MPTFDLSHPLEAGTPVYPGDPPVDVEPVATVADDGYGVARVALGTHAGTHVDAPAHLLADGRSIADYPLETFRFSATVADLRPTEPRDRIGREAVRDACATADSTPRRAATDLDLVVVRTGWEDAWGTDGYLDHPFLEADAAAWLAERWHVGIDAPNVDPTPTDRAGGDDPDGFPAHRALFGAERLVLENLRGLEAVTDAGRFDLHAYPLAVRTDDGAPVRAVAVTR